MVAFWGLVVWAVIGLFRADPRMETTTDASDSQRILDERFAHGGLSEIEYRHRRAILRAGATPGTPLPPSSVQ